MVQMMDLLMEIELDDLTVIVLMERQLDFELLVLRLECLLKSVWLDLLMEIELDHLSNNN